MLLLEQKVETELGIIETLVIHCDCCGKKRLVGGDISKGGANDWIETRRLDRDVPPIHFCCLGHLVEGIQRIQHAGVTKLEISNWKKIKDICSTAGGL